MKPISFLLISASVFSIVAAHAEPITTDPTLSLLEEELIIDPASEPDDLASEWDESFFEGDQELISEASEVALLPDSDVPSNKEQLAQENPEGGINQLAAKTDLSSAESESMLSVAEEVKNEEVALAAPVIEKAKEKNEVAIAAPFEQRQKPVLMKDAVPSVSIDLRQVFSGSPVIYTILFAMSFFALSLWLFNILSIRSSSSMPDVLVKNLKKKLSSNQYEEVLNVCTQYDTLLCKMIASGINVRKQGLHAILDNMRNEGKRSSVAFWQRMALLNDIAIIAPMLGLLGTVLGMFYAFYDLNRSVESISNLFDGLGISVGTTVAGLVVAILAMIFHSTTKYRLVRQLARVENEANSFAALIENKAPSING